MALFSLRNATFRYPSQKEDALHDVNCDIEKGEFLVILGGDGSGKSTLARMLNGLIPQSIKGKFSGEILFEGISMKDIPIHDIVKKVGLALQDPDIQLFMDSIEEELAFGPENLSLSVDEIEKRIAKAMDLMGITALRSKSPKAISGGQKQRLVIASVLTMGTETIVLDEPLSMLDPALKKELLGTLRKMCSQQRISVIITSQDAEDIYRYCDRIALLQEGSIAAIGKPLEILSSAGRLTSLGIEPPQLLGIYDKLKSLGMTNEAEVVGKYFSSQIFSNAGGV